MNYKNNDLLDTDLDWFAVDCTGRVAHFTTAGTGFIPACLKYRRNDLDAVFDELYEVDERTTAVVVEANLPKFETHNQREQYLSSFVNMAKRGYFSFDVAELGRENSKYVLIAIPARPILISEISFKTICNVSIPKFKYKKLNDQNMVVTQEDFAKE